MTLFGSIEPVDYFFMPNLESFSEGGDFTPLKIDCLTILVGERALFSFGVCFYYALSYYNLEEG